ncbi:MAG: sugar nucleotide-binding protein [Proteobacteria bacterium]|nr:sugar nucleotide-binding protein [Pseudomonadota bacterium]MBU4296647.1 sugar nucleotide-binding protein [Pseudomonadota bacterium]MCG2748440.1 sugar nucleotide-binding protein [Desulfobulbaceae bacterium]
MKKNVPLVIGADGQLGSILVSFLTASGAEPWSTTRRETLVGGKKIFLDLIAPATWEWPAGVTSAFVCAAQASLASCEYNPELSREINVVRTLGLIERLLADGIFVVFPSTNLVFSGNTPFAREEAQTSPFNEYGRQKSCVEEELRKFGKNAAIVRLTKIVSSSMPLVKNWLSDLGSSQPIHPFADMSLAPVSARFAAEACCRIAELRKGGIWHVSGSRDITYADFASRLAEEKGWSKSLVQPVKAPDYDFPRFTSLDSVRLQQEAGLASPDLLHVIREIV